MSHKTGKINTTLKAIVKTGEIYWYHPLDAYNMSDAALCR